MPISKRPPQTAQAGSEPIAVVGERSSSAPATKREAPVGWQPRAARAIAIETLVGVTLTLGIVGLLQVPHVGLGTLRPHPIWLAVLVVAARYGARGVIIAAPIGWAALAVVGSPGAHMLGNLLSALSAPVELGALTGAVLVGWVASAHERTAAGFVEQLRQIGARAKTDAAALGELRAAALALRARNDRLELSLTFLRDIARRLDGADPEVAAQAALELAIARLGARAAAVQTFPVAEGNGAQEAAAADRSPQALIPLAAAGVWDWTAVAGGDGTVTAAVGSARPVRAIDLPSATPTDSDLAAPIVIGRNSDSSGTVVGVIALRGVPRGGADMAALRDLAVIAEWVSGAFAASREAAHRESAARAHPQPHSHHHNV
jgi:hypothetical protein